MHWDGTTSASNSHLYLNGSEQTYSFTQNAGGTATAASGLHSVGGYSFSDSSNMDGLLGEVAVWASELSTTQITYLTNGQSPLSVGTPVIYIPYWGDDTREQVTGASPSTTDGTSVSLDHPNIMTPMKRRLM